MRRFVRLLSLACLVLLLAAPAVAAPQPERRVALVIGNGAYKAGPLKNPVNDARDMAAALRELGFEVILRENAGLAQMEQAVDQFWTSLKKGGTGLFFFAGHGMQVKGVNYLVPVDANLQIEQDVKVRCLDVNLVLGRMENAGNPLNLVILDACRNNPFARAWRNAGQGLAKMDAPMGTLIAYATAPDSVAADGAGKNGVYTQHLLRTMRTPGLKVEDVLKQTRIGVIRDTDKRQIPWESSSLTGDFYFRPGAGGQAVPPQQLALAVPPKEALPTVDQSQAWQDDLANSLAGRYAIAWGHKETPSPMVIEFSVKDGQLVGTAGGATEHTRLVSITNIQLQGRVLIFQCDFRVGVGLLGGLFGGTPLTTNYTGELGRELSAIRVKAKNSFGGEGEDWLVRLP
ncbi:MAG: caspase family protein [Humidesulfovibrio sp.]|uniref:caspase family protein n=1 Tax=Humidesulfovibrio sp. TaxID=2910988 RepID=UPI0027EE78D7|nr:caspase family protein [Humidesulfovibrio sp.]MDQ7834648.1 caspase family protein [Humidesulfovibrio sp.]